MSERLNSYEALKAKREALCAEQMSQERRVEIRVALGTCAIATGAKNVVSWEAFIASRCTASIPLLTPRKESKCAN